MAGERYLVGIYELRPGEDPETADFRDRTFMEKAGKAALGFSIGVLMAPLVAPFPFNLFWAAILAQGVAADVAAEKLAQGRPFQDCCFLWIQEKESGKVVGGVTPRGFRSD